jgi:hypothetical protein
VLFAHRRADAAGKMPAARKHYRSSSSTPPPSPVPLLVYSLTDNNHSFIVLPALTILMQMPGEWLLAIYRPRNETERTTLIESTNNSLKKKIENVRTRREAENIHVTRRRFYLSCHSPVKQSFNRFWAC